MMVCFPGLSFKRKHHGKMKRRGYGKTAVDNLRFGAQLAMVRMHSEDKKGVGGVNKANHRIWTMMDGAFLANVYLCLFLSFFLLVAWC
jgi:hypothetical protein